VPAWFGGKLRGKRPTDLGRHLAAQLTRYHAREHVHDLANLLGDALGDTRSGWVAARLDELDRGNIAALADAARHVPLPAGVSAADLERALGYFEDNACRMRYATFRRLGMFVGSGTVEAGCKSLVGQRLKCSGMRWNTPGATGILTLRAKQASRGHGPSWRPPDNQAQTA
jgi:hypothetical protein